MTTGTTDWQSLVITAVDGTEYELYGWLTARLRDHLPGDAPVEPDVPLTEYGLDAVVALALYGEIEELFALGLDPGTVYRFATVDELAVHLGGLAAARPSGPAARS
ncbi:acyl carrier protein [Kitasatospora sp. NBC_00085]|uniref:acyl carrier protein n=1 Tax=unclassified Kitasatospora TaxID=2633591 RepID=UPI00324EDCEB